MKNDQFKKTFKKDIIKSQKLEKSLPNSVEMSTILLSYARGLQKEGELKSEFASTFIYACLAEYFSLIVLSHIEVSISEITTAVKAPNFYFNFVKNKEIATNLEQTIKRIDYYIFPQKDTLLRLLKKIKKERNIIFHNFVTATEKDIKIGREMKTLREDVEELLKLLMIFLKVPKFQDNS